MNVFTPVSHDASLVHTELTMPAPRSGDWGLSVPVAFMRLEQHLRWCRLRNLAPNTIRDRRLVLLRLAAYIGRPPSEATAAELEAWQETLAVGPGTRFRYFSHVRAYFAWLAVTGIRPDDPTGVLVMPRLGTYLPRPIATADLIRAVTEAPARVRPWLVLAAWCGFRCVEIALLRRESVFELAQPQPYIHVTAAATKGNHERIVPMSEPVRAELVPILPRRGFVFPRADGRPGPNTPSRISQAANQHLADLGLTDTMHTLRHWFGTETYEATKDIRVVQELMGHQTPVPTAIYTKISNAAKTAAVAALPPPPGRHPFAAAIPAAVPAVKAVGVMLAMLLHMLGPALVCTAELGPHHHRRRAPACAVWQITDRR